MTIDEKIESVQKAIKDTDEALKSFVLLYAEALAKEESRKLLMSETTKRKEQKMPEKPKSFKLCNKCGELKRFADVQSIDTTVKKQRLFLNVCVDCLAEWVSCWKLVITK